MKVVVNRVLFISGPMAGALANKFGFRMVAITGSIMAASGLGISYFSNDLGMLYFFYGAIGGVLSMQPH